MKKLTPFIVSSLMIMTIVSAPLVSFADNNKNENGQNENRDKKVSVENKFRAKFTKKSNSNSIWNRMANFWGKHVNADTNLGPVITSMTTPTLLKVGETGTWEIKASDPQNGSLTYGVDWGDNATQPISQLDRAVYLQTGTFTHAYAKAGNYKIKFTVSNSAGLKTSNTATVHVIGSPTTDNRSPVIKNLDGAKSIVIGQTETVTIKAYDPNNTSLTYGVNWGDSSSIAPGLSRTASPIYLQTATFDHVYNTAGTYTATFTVTNSAGLTASSSINITVTPVVVDTTAPVISNVEVRTGLATSTISWTTDEPSTSKVFYSTGTPVDVNLGTTLSVSDASLVKAHSLNILGLTANTLYHFKIVSADNSNNMSTSSEATFATTF